MPIRRARLLKKKSSSHPSLKSKKTTVSSPASDKLRSALRSHPAYSKEKVVDICVLAISLLVAPFLSIWLQLPMFFATLLFFGPTCIWLSLRLPRLVPKILVFSLVVGSVVGALLDFLFTVNGAWIVSTIFPWRFFGVVPIEDLFYGFSQIYVVLITYERFENKFHHPKTARRFWWFPAALGLVAIGVTYLALYSFPLLMIPYFYFVAGMGIFVFPTLIFLLQHPHIIAKFIWPSFYFFIVSVIFELTSLSLVHWSFPGMYIGWMHVFDFSLPLEEFFIWIMFITPAIMAYYELLDDDGK